MLRPTILKAVKPSLRSAVPAYRTISSTAIRMAEGDTGGVRSGGGAQGDAFSKREEAQENLFVRQREMEKLKALRDKIAEQKAHLAELEANVSEQMKKGE